MSKLSDFTIRPLLTAISSAISALSDKTTADRNTLSTAISAATPPAGTVIQLRMPQGSATPAGYSLLADNTTPLPASPSGYISPTFLTEYAPNATIRSSLPAIFRQQASQGLPGAFGAQFLETSTHFWVLQHSGAYGTGFQPLLLYRFTKDWQFVDSTLLNSSSLASHNAFTYGDAIYIPAIACGTNSWNSYHSQSYLLKFTPSTMTLSTFWTQTATTGLGGNRLILLKIANFVYMLGHPAFANNGVPTPDRHAYRLDLDTGTGTLINNWLPSPVVYPLTSGDTFNSFPLTFWTGRDNYMGYNHANFFSDIPANPALNATRLHRFVRTYELPNGVSLAINLLANYTFVSNNPQLITANAAGVLSMRTLDGTDLPRPAATQVANPAIPFLSGMFLDFETSTLVIPWLPVATATDPICYYGYRIGSDGVITYVGPIAVAENWAKALQPLLTTQQPATYANPLFHVNLRPSSNVASVNSNALATLRLATSGSSTPPTPTGVRYFVKN